MPADREFPLHYESSAILSATPEIAFAHLDDFRRLSAHMQKRSWMMLGARMSITTDSLEGRAPGSRIRMEGRVIGIKVSLEEVVTERRPPLKKVWQTIDARLLVIGQYRLGFLLSPCPEGSALTVFIDYELPLRVRGRWMGALFSRPYARWCTETIIRDAVTAFGA